MKTIISILVLCTVILVSGCAEPEPATTPTETVYDFASSFKSESYDACYQMMGSDYQEEHPFANFIDDCDDFSADQYQFITVSNEYIHENNAIVAVKYNATEERLNVSWSGIGTTIVTEMHEDKIELVNEGGEWKFDTFPKVIV